MEIETKSGNVVLRKYFTPGTCAYILQYRNTTRIVFDEQAWNDLQECMLQLLKIEKATKK